MSLPVGATIGILGAGQLGRMLACAAAKLGFRTISYAPAGEAPAREVTGAHFEAAYDDTVTLTRFARACDVVTVEFENVPVAAAETVSATGTPFRPGPKALAVAQDRANEKTFLEGCGIACAPWRTVDSEADLKSALSEIGPDAILKTRREGYDGKGQVRLGTKADPAAAWADIQGAPAILEGFVPFEMEISVIIVRGTDGDMLTYTPPQNEHAGGILRKCIVPAPVSPDVASEAVAKAKALAKALDYVGVLALEFFVGRNGDVVANEFAPRVHNSGHWTPEACETGQFENHIRAVAGWPLGSTKLLFPAEMDNLIGEDAGRPVPELLEQGSLTLYGKGEIRPGRKMGHIVRRRG